MLFLNGGLIIYHGLNKARFYAGRIFYQNIDKRGRMMDKNIHAGIEQVKTRLLKTAKNAIKGLFQN